MRLAIARIVYTLSQVDYFVDRPSWLYENRKLLGGLEFVVESPTLRFIFAKLTASDNLGNKLTDVAEKNFGSLC